MASANELFEAARAAMARAHVPYSKFPVGAPFSPTPVGFSPAAT